MNYGIDSEDEMQLQEDEPNKKQMTFEAVMKPGDLKQVTRLIKHDELKQDSITDPAHLKRPEVDLWGGGGGDHRDERDVLDIDDIEEIEMIDDGKAN